MQYFRRGQVFGFIVAIVAMSSALVLGILGHQIPSAIIGGGTLAALVYTFIKGGFGRETKAGL